MNFEVINNKAEFLKWQSEWNRIYNQQESTTCFSSWEWHLALHEFSQSSNLNMNFFVARDIKNTLAILPFYRIGSSAKFIMGDPMVADYFDFLIDCAELDRVKNEFLYWMSKQYRGFELIAPRIRGTSVSHKLLQGLTGKTVTKHVCNAPVLKMETTWDEFCENLDKKLKQELRTTQNKILRQFSVEAIFKWDDYSDETYDCLINFHRQRQKEKVGKSIFDNVNYADLLRRLLMNQNKYFKVQLSTLRIKDQVVSTTIGIVDRGTFRYWIPTFDQSLRLGSLGKLHLSKLVEQSFAGGFDEFDLMIGEESYKLKWANDFYECHQHNVFDGLVNYKYFSLKSHTMKQLRKLKKMIT